jgi:hypothetical protein
MFRRVRLWHTLATGFLLKAFAERAGIPDDRAVRAAIAFDRLVPPAAGTMPAVL